MTRVGVQTAGIIGAFPVFCVNENVDKSVPSIIVLVGAAKSLIITSPVNIVFPVGFPILVAAVPVEFISVVPSIVFVVDVKLHANIEKNNQ